VYPFLPLVHHDRLFLDRHQSSRPDRRCENGYPRLQLPLLQLPFRRRARHVGRHHPFTRVLPTGVGDVERNLEQAVEGLLGGSGKDVDYENIGSRLSILAESFGMRVVFHDVMQIMLLGRTRQVESLQALLAQSDFVSTLHVPELPDALNMISATQLARMKRGSYLIDNARRDLAPTNLLGRSAEEVQRVIGEEVSSSLVRYLNFGSTIGAVNFPEVDLRAITAEQGEKVRVCHAHNK